MLAMKQLSSFSIETDQMVNLIFADGTSYRVKKQDLASLLATPDLKQVLAGFKTRRKFLNETLPPWARAIAIAIIAISVGAGSMRAYGFWVAKTATPHKQVASAPEPKTDTSSQVLAASTSNTTSVTSTPPPTPPTASPTVSSPVSTAQVVKTQPGVKAVALPNTAVSVAVPNPVSAVQHVATKAVTTVAGTLHKLGL